MNFIITGIFRSGTTLLTRALSTHPEIEAIYQPFSFFFKSWRSEALNNLKIGKYEFFPMGLNIADQHGVEKEFFYMLDAAEIDGMEFKHITESLKEIYDGDKEFSTYIKYILNDENKKFESVSKRLYNETLISMMEGARKYHQKSIFGIKELWLSDMVGYLMEYLDIKVINIVRDPRAVLASRNYGRYIQRAGKRYPLKFIAELWRGSAELLQKYKYNKNFLFVKYEDLIINPEYELGRICDFLDVKLTDEMLHPKNYKDGYGKRWKINSSYGQVKDFDRSLLLRWVNVLAESEIAYMEYLCKDFMVFLGYDIHMHVNGSEKYLNYKESRRDIVDWLARSDFVKTI